MSSRNIVILLLAVLLIGLLIFLFYGNEGDKAEKVTAIAPVISPLPNANENHIAIPQAHNDYVAKPGLTEAEVLAIVKKYIDENPEAVMKSIENYYAAKADEAQAIQKDAVIKLKDQIYNNLNDPKIGNPKGTIKIVEFFDYACSFCRKMLPVHQKILAEYNDVQIILKELPIMGDWSIMASKAALAVSIIDNGKYVSFHNRLLNLNERTEDNLMQAAAAEGIDIAKMKEAMQKAEVEDMIQANLKLSSDLKIRGTPAYIINNNVLPGALSYTEIKSALEAAGAKKVQVSDTKVSAQPVLSMPVNSQASDEIEAKEEVQPLVPANDNLNKDEIVKSNELKAVAQ